MAFNIINVAISNLLHSIFYKYSPCCLLGNWVERVYLWAGDGQLSTRIVKNGRSQYLTVLQVFANLQHLKWWCPSIPCQLRHLSSKNDPWCGSPDRPHIGAESEASLTSMTILLGMEPIVAEMKVVKINKNKK